MAHGKTSDNVSREDRLAPQDLRKRREASTLG